MERPLQAASSKPNLEPYGQLLRMLMPRALGIGFYDARGAPLWVADGYEGPDPTPLVAAALERVPPATTARIDGFVQDHEGAPAYVFRIRGEAGGVIAVATLLTRDSENRPYGFVQSLVQPALECLQRELEARTSVDNLTDELRSRDDDLDLLLKMAPEDPGSPEAGDELGVMVQTCVDHLGCLLGALVVPERNIAVCKAPRGNAVKAIYDGRVAYADWLPGMGLLIIVDHGGYMSLYAHNEQLNKAVGDRVSAGDQIATVGDSGGRAQPGLYLEIRRGARPVDPVPWFRRPSP
jgi:hypothetical protein